MNIEDTLHWPGRLTHVAAHRIMTLAHRETHSGQVPFPRVLAHSASEGCVIDTCADTKILAKMKVTKVSRCSPYMMA